MTILPYSVFNFYFVFFKYVDKQKNFICNVYWQIFAGDVTKGEVGTTAIPGKEADFVSNLKVTIDYAKALNAKKIHIMAGKIDDACTANWETYENNLKYAANKLEEENIMGVIEPINQHSVPKYFLSDYEKGNYNLCTK